MDFRGRIDERSLSLNNTLVAAIIGSVMTFVSFVMIAVRTEFWVIIPVYAAVLYFISLGLVVRHQSYYGKKAIENQMKKYHLNLLKTILAAFYVIMIFYIFPVSIYEFFSYNLAIDAAGAVLLAALLVKMSGKKG